jgi:FkbM family methyltransferase
MGYDLRRASGALGEDPFRDMKRLAGAVKPAVVIDVGANVGQSVARFREVFDRPLIHAFEPGDRAFAELQRRTSGTPGLCLNRCALGPRPGHGDLIENTCSDMSSFLEPGPENWGSVERRVQVPIGTIDEYCAERGVTRIDVLKTDTQGFDLEVLRGAQDLMERHAVHLVLLEITFSALYEGLPDLDEIYAFMRGAGFVLVSFYQFHYRHDRAGWTDALFVDPRFGAGAVGEFCKGAGAARAPAMSCAAGRENAGNAFSRPGGPR